jgi:soluble lytic murein transglycosylase
MRSRIYPIQLLIVVCGLLIFAGCEIIEAPVKPVANPPARQSAPIEPPVATPMPAADLLARGLERRAIGDVDAAAADFSRILQHYPDSPEAGPARFYLAESFAERGRWTSAVETLHDLLAMADNDGLSAPALFWLARGYENAGDWANASNAYAGYRDLATPLEPYAALRQAAQFQALGDLAAAGNGYEHAARSNIARSQRAAAYERAIAVRREAGDQQRAADLYTELLAFAEQPAYRARILSEAAALADSMGDPTLARDYRIEIARRSPDSSQAPVAVDRLLAAGNPGLAPSEIAAVLFAAGRYQDALPFFDAALAEADDDAAIELQRQRGLALRGLGLFAEALQSLADAADATAPDDTRGRQARLDWIQTLGQSGDTERAIAEYRDFADRFNDDPRAPEALDRAAQLLDRLQRFDEAGEVRLELGRRFPRSNQGASALHRSGLAHFQAADYAVAEQNWRLLADSHSGYERARGAFWAGRAAVARGDDAAALAYFTTARSAAADSYYGARAGEELGVAMNGATSIGASILPPGWRELEGWVAGWSGIALPAIDAAGIDPAVGEYPAIERALALAQVGLHNEAGAEWHAALDHFADDPGLLVHLARIAYDHAETYVALQAARQIMALAPAESSAPPTLRRLLFPTPYPNLVLAESQAQEVDPLLFYALMRQESLFQPRATSWVGARGLAQVMPETGQGIAAQLGISNFEIDALYQPYVSVRFGTFYLGQRIDDMNGSIHGGLASYNGGLGNAMRWAGGSQVADADMFTELIDFPETEGYVKSVYGYYGAYRHLYNLP